MKLMEVIRIPETSDSTFQLAMAFGKKVGKVCVTCKDTPGFVVNRLLIPYMAESIRMLEVSHQCIDNLILKIITFNSRISAAMPQLVTSMLQ